MEPSKVYFTNMRTNNNINLPQKLKKLMKAAAVSYTHLISLFAQRLSRWVICVAIVVMIIVYTIVRFPIPVFCQKSRSAD